MSFGDTGAARWGSRRTAAPADGSYGREEKTLTVFGIALAGAFGALARYGLDGLVAQRAPGAFPWGTLAVNVTGSLALGFLFTLLTETVEIDPWLRSSLTIGFVGAYTTFSTLSLETYRLLADDATGLAVANIGASIAGGLTAVYVGVVVARAVA